MGVFKSLSVLTSAYCLLLSTVECTQTNCSNTSPCKNFRTGDPMARCPELVSSNGFLAVTLEVREGVLTFDWLKLPRRTYNGTACPPTWRVKPGDTINVTLLNNLGPNPDITPPINSQRLPNTTNIHTHGLHISPKDPQDNVFIEIEPGEKREYSFEIEPDHPSGTFWYHPHSHGSGELQVGGGMTGLIIVEDNVTTAPAELNAVSCPDHCEHDIFFMFQGILGGPHVFVQVDINDGMRLNDVEIIGGGNLEDWFLDNLLYITTNGQLMPTQEIEQGQMKRFRLVNSGPEMVIELLLIAANDSESQCDIREIAIDGIYFDRPRRQKFGQSLVLPGSRVDWMVKCDDAGSYELKTKALQQHNPSIITTRWPEQVLATIKVVKSSVETPMEFPDILPERPHYFSDLQNVHVDQRIVLEVDEDFSINREKWTGPTDFRYKMEVDRVVEMQLISTIPTFSHPMHFHVNHFQVIGYEQYVGPWALNKFLDPDWELYDQTSGEACHYQHKDHSGKPDANLTNPLMYLGHDQRWQTDGNFTLGYPQPGEWRDGILVQALANITIRMKLHKFTGPLLYHCHLLSDADRGMMLVMEIVEKGGNLTGARIDSAGAFPGSCLLCDWNMFRNISEECTPTTVPATTEATTTTTNNGRRERSQGSSFVMVFIVQIVGYHFGKDDW